MHSEWVLWVMYRVLCVLRELISTRPDQVPQNEEWQPQLLYGYEEWIYCHIQCNSVIKFHPFLLDGYNHVIPNNTASLLSRLYKEWFLKDSEDTLYYLSLRIGDEFQSFVQKWPV